MTGPPMASFIRRTAVAGGCDRLRTAHGCDAGCVVQPPRHGQAYRRERRALLAHNPRCQLRIACDGALADSADHDPPLALHDHVLGTICCRLVPACLACQHLQGGLMRSGRWRRRALPEPSRAW